MVLPLHGGEAARVLLYNFNADANLNVATSRTTVELTTLYLRTSTIISGASSSQFATNFIQQFSLSSFPPVDDGVICEVPNHCDAIHGFLRELY
jgi:hypothetical protein